MPKPYPQEFSDDVVAVARKREAPLKQIAKDREGLRDLRGLFVELVEEGRCRGRDASWYSRTWSTCDDAVSCCNSSESVSPGSRQSRVDHERLCSKCARECACPSFYW